MGRWGRSQQHTEGVGGVTTVAMMNGVERLIGQSLTLKARAPPPLPPPLIRSFAAWLRPLPPPLLPVFPLTLIGPAQPPLDCFSQ